jgi:hypothetical protein
MDNKHINMGRLMLNLLKKRLPQWIGPGLFFTAVLATTYRGINQFIEKYPNSSMILKNFFHGIAKTPQAVASTNEKTTNELPSSNNEDGFDPLMVLDKEKLKMITSLVKKYKDYEDEIQGINLKKKALEASTLQLKKEIKQFQTLQKSWKSLLDEMKKIHDQDMTNLIKICEAMNAKKAAKQLSTVDVLTLKMIIQKISQKKAAMILENLPASKVQQVITMISRENFQASSQSPIKKS